MMMMMMMMMVVMMMMMMMMMMMRKIIDFLDLAQIRDSKNVHLTSGAPQVGYILRIKFGQKIRLNQPGCTSRNRGKWEHSPARNFRLSLKIAVLVILAVFHVDRTPDTITTKNPAMWRSAS